MNLHLTDPSQDRPDTAELLGRRVISSKWAATTNQWAILVRSHLFHEACSAVHEDPRRTSFIMWYSAHAKCSFHVQPPERPIQLRALIPRDHRG